MKFKLILAFTLICIGLFLVFAYTYTNAPQPSAVEEDYADCLALESENAVGTCMEQLARTVYSQTSVREITAALDTLSFEEKNRWCHEFMHYLGWRVYEVEGNIAEAFVYASELCDSGMYHGVVEAFLRTEGLSANLPHLIRTVCTDALKDNLALSEGTLSLCFHGLGHGLMFITSSDLQGSLDYCDELPSLYVSQCYGGVFMEHTASKAIGPTKNEKVLEDFSYCDSLREHQKTDCYNRQGINNLSWANGDGYAAIQKCLEVPSAYQEVCFEGVGSNIPAPGKSPANAAHECADVGTLAPQAYTKCIDGALGFVMQLAQGDIRDAVIFCSAIISDAQERCVTTAGMLARQWVKDDVSLRDECASFASTQERTWCENGVQY